MFIFISKIVLSTLLTVSLFVLGLFLVETRKDKDYGKILSLVIFLMAMMLASIVLMWR